ncbi:MAG: chromosome segregation protein SMC [Xenococcaceae cyanobacterium MO_188.B32]|nr:chromosome segregation protein SMC [Xenococcaceae cyanobacterium MO_188.B32]
MVHIKRVELSHFKSFGGTTKVPILPGFTVVSGPNGSGKSNILDALLFCLGLASSRGMRAERLPDLVNHKHSNNGRTAEAIVSVTFDLSDLGDLEETVATSTEVISVSEELLEDEGDEGDREDKGDEEENHDGNGNGKVEAEKDIKDIQVIDNNGSLEWTVTRRLRVTKGGNYSSTFYINGQVVTATELHEQLEKLRIYPEGYNVVLQGDVTRIITMNSRERREIIDELAGVAAFDRKIEQTRKTLDKVREREEHYHIIEQELVANRDRLAADRVKAEKYRKLKEKVQLQKQQELVLVWKSLQQKQEELQIEITKGKVKADRLTEELAKLDTEIKDKSISLDELNSRVKALGEDEQLSVASKLATQKAKRQQLQQQQIELTTNLQQTQNAIAQTENNIQQYSQELDRLTVTKTQLANEIIPNLSQQCDRARETLTKSKESADAIAAASEAWVQEQANLTRNISTIQDTLNPQRTERAQLTERLNQLESKFAEQTQLLQTTEQELTEKQTGVDELSDRVTAAEEKITNLAQQLTILEHDRAVANDTQKRLLKEQRDKQRELDRLEATKQAQQEAQGTYASQIILNANLPGVHGLVAQLGQVDSRYQLALETAAGGRLGCIVVENDSVGAQGIELLKRQRGGRATFLPLNKIQAPRLLDTTNLRYANGYIDLAVNLIKCNSRYQKIFAYVFSNTVVFDRLDRARSYIGKYRIVTLEGEILEASGAMTGGSQSSRSSLHFGTATTGESLEIKTLRQRLTEIARILAGNEEIIAKQSEQIEQLKQELTENRQQHREKQLRWEQLQQEIARLTKQQEQLTTQVSNHQQEKEKIISRLQVLATSIPEQEIKLQACQQRLNELEESHDRSEWQQVQASIKSQENELYDREIKLREAENNLKDTENKHQRLSEKIAESQENLETLNDRQLAISNRQLAISSQLTELEQKIIQGERELQQLTEKLGETKKERDRVENQLKELQNQQQQKSWQLEKINTDRQERKTHLASLEQQIAEQAQELPDPLPEIPELVNTDSESTEQITFANIQEHLEQIQKQIRNGEKRLEAMEPVNMLALEEYEKTEARLQELSEKLNTIAAERTELLLRVEKFTTLRLRAFKESFDAVNKNFQTIFAELSDGDGHLQLDDEDDPFNGGLNLVAHPKGKPVQRLSSMSGGEKSLTALSFIFSLQKYRPSPFYAFDEVDMFLDGANVEKLSRMVKKQAQEAQFIVVSLRRPMIEASERTIGVTQARGAHTQVLGIKMS